MRPQAWLGVLVFLLSPHGLAGPPDVVPTDSLKQRLRPCLACHSTQNTDLGRDYVPHLNAKPAGYLYNQLLNYREGRRGNPAMVHMVRNLSDRYLSEMASYFSDQKMAFRERKTGDVKETLLARGKKLVTEGNQQGEIPACQSCHGERLTGVRPHTPGLVGLPSYYLSAQLGAWREGTRQAAAPDCMRKIATQLTSRDIRAVASWLASRPVPENPQPASTPPADPPMACGSVSLPGGPR